jgi:hypothetical protein
MKGEEDMKRFSILVCCLSIGLAVFCRPTPANAQSAVIGGCGFVLSSDCTSPDKTSLAKSVKISLNAAGVWTSDCSGTTTTTPTTATKCDGETLNANSTEVSPADPCSMALEQFGGTTGPVLSDDWTETITPSGKVHLVQVHPERNRQITSYV